MTPNDSARAAATEVERVIAAFGEQAAARDGLIQLAVIAAALGLAWLVSRSLRKRLDAGPVRWKFGEGGFHRVAFPAIALLLVAGARVALDNYMHTPFLRLATTLLVAYAAIRLCVYILRFLMPRGSLLRASERTIAWLMWMGVVLHVTGLLPEVRDMLASVSIPIGQQRLSLLMVFDGAIAVAVTLAITMWLARIIEGRVMGNSAVEMSTRVVVSKLVNAVAFFVAVIIALPLAGLDLTALTVFGGALGVGLGFGLQKIASNYVSGFIILLDRSVRIGDLVTIDGRHGTVREIASRCTIVKSGDGTESLIPNELLITQSVTNHSYSDRMAALKVPIVLPHDADVDAAMATLLAAAKAHPQVVSEPAPVVLVTRLLETGIEIELTAWIPDIAAGVGVLRSDLLRATVKDFAARGIPYRPAPREMLLATGETVIPTAKSAS